MKLGVNIMPLKARYPKLVAINFVQ